MLADNHVCDMLVGDVWKGDQSLPAAPAGRLCGLRADDVSNHRVQAIRTDQEIPFGRAAVVELQPNSVLRTDDPDRTGIAPDAIGRKAFQQPFKQDSTWDHPNWCSQPVHDRSQVHNGGWAPHSRTGGRRLPAPLHIPPQLPQTVRAVGPDGYGAAPRLHIRPPFEDG